MDKGGRQTRVVKAAAVAAYMDTAGMGLVLRGRV